MMYKRIKLALCVGVLLTAGVACEELPSETESRTELGTDPADATLNVMAADMAWESRSPSDQADLCLAHGTFDKARVMALLTADMTGTVAENLALGEAIYAKFTEECS